MRVLKGIAEFVGVVAQLATLTFVVVLAIHGYHADGYHAAVLVLVVGIPAAFFLTFVAFMVVAFPVYFLVSWYTAWRVFPAYLGEPAETGGSGPGTIGWLLGDDIMFTNGSASVQRSYQPQDFESWTIEQDYQKLTDFPGMDDRHEGALVLDRNTKQGAVRIWCQPTRQKRWERRLVAAGVPRR